MIRDNILAVDRDHVRDEDGRRVTVAGPFCWLGVEIVPEFSFSLLNFARAAASAAFDFSVTDDPDGLFDNFSASVFDGWLEP